MNHPIRKLDKSEFPKALLEIADPPKQLFIRGTLPSDDLTYLAIVGSRKHTPYGRDACDMLIRGLAGYPVCIVSGLALGIDSIAHKTALKYKLPTISFPGSGLDPSVLYPASNRELAEDIVRYGGAMISEFDPTFRAAQWTFPARNRLMAGIADAVLIIEAEEKSGTLITARLALDYNKDVLAVPGSVFSENSAGTNRLIREGATPIRSSADILEVLGFKTEEVTQSKNLSLPKSEQTVYDALREPISRDDLAYELDMPIHLLNIELTKLELKEIIREELGKIYRVR